MTTSKATKAQGILLPFMLNDTPVRGRVARLDAVVDTIIQRHDYPHCVAKLLAETLVVAAMLAAQLKQEGIFTIQIKGDGPIRMLVADAAFDGGLRGYAEVAPEGRDALASLEATDLSDLFGENGYLAITLDPGEGRQRYQGVVAVEGENIADAVSNYFTHSQQLNIALNLAVLQTRLDHTTHWQAAGMMIEQMPDTQAMAKAEAKEEDATSEAWRYASVMMKTVKPEELLNQKLAAETLLEQLYHEQGVLVYPPKIYYPGCRCSRERIQQLLLSMADDERAEMLVDGVASVHCQFCNKQENFDAHDLKIVAH